MNATKSHAEQLTGLKSFVIICRRNFREEYKNISLQQKNGGFKK